MRHSLLIALGLLVTASCAEVFGPGGDPSRADDLVALPGVSLVVEPLDAGSTNLDVRLANRSGDRIGYNLCRSWLEMQVGDGWSRIEPFRLCTADLRMLETGEDALWREPIEDSLQPGRYRFATSIVAPNGSPAEVRSDPFTVPE